MQKEIPQPININKSQIEKRQMVINSVCAYFGITWEYVMSNTKSRKTEHRNPRYLIMFFLRLARFGSWSEIGEIFWKDHATAIHGYNQICIGLNLNYPDIVDAVNTIRHDLTRDSITAHSILKKYVPEYNKVKRAKEITYAQVLEMLELAIKKC